MNEKEFYGRDEIPNSLEQRAKDANAVIQEATKILQHMGDQRHAGDMGFRKDAENLHNMVAEIKPENIDCAIVYVKHKTGIRSTPSGELVNHFNISGRYVGDLEELTALQMILGAHISLLEVEQEKSKLNTKH